jgi:GxxExxY protein
MVVDVVRWVWDAVTIRSSIHGIVHAWEISMNSDQDSVVVDQPFAQVGYDVMGACFEVHRVLGGGLLEEIYQESLELEFTIRAIPFVAKGVLPVYYKDRRLQKQYVPDLIVADHVIVELKSVKEMIPEHEAQLFNYLRICRQPVGYLVNFGTLKKLEWKRYVLSEFVSDHG